MELIYGPSSVDVSEWQQARRECVTATDVAKLANGGASVWAQLRNEKLHGSKFTGNKYTAHGTAREPVIADRVKDHGWEHNQHLMLWEQDRRFAATPDLIHDAWDMVGDIKTRKREPKFPPEEYTPPQEHVDQVLWQMLVTGARAGLIITECYGEVDGVMWPEPDLYEFKVEWDDDRIGYLKDTATKFLKKSDSYLDLLLADYATELANYQVAKDQKDEVLGRIKKQADAQGAPFKYVSEVGSVSYVKSKPAERFDWKKMWAEHPELHELMDSYKSTVDKAPTLRVTPVKED